MIMDTTFAIAASRDVLLSTPNVIEYLQGPTLLTVIKQTSSGFSIWLNQYK